MSKKSCFFTGHRTVKITGELLERLDSKLTEMINDGITDFYAGGAVGWDTICAKRVLALKEKYPQIRFHLVLPCPPKQQTLKWNDDQKTEYDMILKNADDTRIVSKEYTNDCMRNRNARLVELGDICICYYNEKDKRSGTGQTVRMAEKADKTIINMYR